MKRRRVIGFLLALALMGCLLPIHALAIDLMDPERPVDLTVISKFDGAALAGERFDLYKVATADEQCRMTPTEAFRPYISGDLNKMESWEKLNKALYKAVLASPEKFPIAYTGETDEGGKAEFTVDAGLYLILGRPHIQNNRLFTQNPILLMLPNRPEGQETWDYSVVVHNKPQEPADARKITVIKVWDDKNDAYGKRPDTLDVYIVNEKGEKLKATLPFEGKWEYTWDDRNGLEYGHTWEAYEDETHLNGYRLVGDEVDTNGKDEIVFTLTNRYRESTPGKPPMLPQTGQLWWPVPVLLALSLGCLLLGLIRRRGDSHET